MGVGHLTLGAQTDTLIPTGRRQLSTPRQHLISLQTPPSPVSAPRFTPLLVFYGVQVESALRRKDLSSPQGEINATRSRPLWGETSTLANLVVRLACEGIYWSGKRSLLGPCCGI